MSKFWFYHNFSNEGQYAKHGRASWKREDDHEKDLRISLDTPISDSYEISRGLIFCAIILSSG